MFSQLRLLRVQQADDREMLQEMRRSLDLEKYKNKIILSPYEFQDIELAKVHRPNFLASNIPHRAYRAHLPSSSQMIYYDDYDETPNYARNILNLQHVAIPKQPLLVYQH